MNKRIPYNPFLIAGYYSPEFFCDRETETTKIISALENGRNISLISPRRFGKTGKYFYKSGVAFRICKNIHIFAG